MDDLDPVVDARSPGGTAVLERSVESDPSDAETDPPAPTHAEGSDAGSSWAARAPLLLVVAIGVLFLVTASPWIGSRFGESHDGRNAAVWAMSSNAIRSDGVIDSKFGGKAEHQTYANHPPGIIAETTIAETVAGEHRLVTRAPAWLGSLVALALLTLLLIDAGLSRWAAASGVAVAGSSAMFLVYGSMLDTPVTAMPFTLGALVAVQRAVQRRPLPTWSYAVLGLLVAFAGWESTAIVAASGLWLAITTFRTRASWAPLLALAAGNVAGLSVTALWIRWVYGSFTDFTNEAGYRTSDVSLSTSLGHQLEALQDLVPLAGAIGLLGLALAFSRSSRRPLAAVTLLPVIAYALVFKGGADIHDYWNFAILIPLALGAAVVAEAVGNTLTDRFTVRGPAVVLVIAALCSVLSAATPSNAERSLAGSLGGPHLLDVAERMAPADGPPLAYLSAGGALSPWITYESGRPGLPLADFAELEALAERSPEFPVLVLINPSNRRSATFLEARAAARDGSWAIVEAADVVRVLAMRPGS